MAAQESTTVRVSRRAHQTLTEIAERQHTSASELLERLVERERRHEMLCQYNARMDAFLADPARRALWANEVASSERSAEELTRRDASALAR